MPDGYLGEGNWTDNFTWQDLLSAAITLALAVGIGTLWVRWRRDR